MKVCRLARVDALKRKFGKDGENLASGWGRKFVSPEGVTDVVVPDQKEGGRKQVEKVSQVISSDR